MLFLDGEASEKPGVEHDVYYVLDTGDPAQEQFLYNLNHFYQDGSIKSGRKPLVIDVSDKRFGHIYMGDVDYINDSKGIFLAKLKPRRLPQVIIYKNKKINKVIDGLVFIDGRGEIFHKK